MLESYAGVRAVMLEFLDRVGYGGAAPTLLLYLLLGQVKRVPVRTAAVAAG